MEFKEYLTIFKKNIRTFILTVAVMAVLGGVYYFLQPLNFKSVLTLNVTRKGAQQTSDYKYDDFYRLQADERFADTVVRWLESPRIATDILVAAEIEAAPLTLRQLGRYFRAQRLSSQTIKVAYTTTDAKLAKKITTSLVAVLNNNTDNLNKLQNEESWFILTGEDPIIRENRASFPLAMSISLAVGLFFGVWAVFIRHYLK